MKGIYLEMTDFEKVERPIKKLDIKDLTIDFLVDFYLRNDSHDQYVLLIYEDAEYLTAFSINSAHNCVNEKAMKEKLSNLYHGVVPQNVMVIPSGRFVISRETFINYFEKEQNKDEEIDASFDCCIFAQYIAPRLGITKRFVGEEPNDFITRQYNTQLKVILPKYGVEVVEIPTKVFGDKVISASRVRMLYKRKQWEDLRKLVPHTTYSCLYEQDGRVWERGKKDHERKHTLDILLDIRQKQRKGMETLKQFFATGRRVVIYGIGRDADILFEHIPEKLSGEIVFCDKKAVDKEIWYRGKKVMTPDCIQTDDFIYIATTRYKEEIYVNLLNRGIAKSRIGIMKEG